MNTIIRKHTLAGWQTHFEKSNYLSSPNYDETIHYFEKFVKETNYARMITIAESPQGRDVKCLIVAGRSTFTPKQAKRKKKAIVLIQNGIHSGEIEGKDAAMLLLREILITQKKKHLLNNLVLLILPIFNVDGHERVSPFNRPNQNGPIEMGWRTNAQNLNLNRDYMKADSPEMRGWLKLFTEWRPDFVIDNHSSNGADYQYHITYALERNENVFPALSKFASQKFLPYMLNKVESDGFLTAPYIETRNGSLKDGITIQAYPPRLSNGYCAIQNRICLLVETHSLKPFENRVRSTYSMNEATLEFINNNHLDLLSLNRKADELTTKKFAIQKKPFPINFRLKDESVPMKFKGFETYEEHSEVTNSQVVRYTKNPTEFDIPLFDKVEVCETVKLPYAYSIPKEFFNIIKILKLHGVKVDELHDQKKVKVEKYRFVKSDFAPRPYENRQQVSVEIETLIENTILHKGDFIVKTNQRALRVIANLLEPKAPDSFVRWGFFNAFFERKEYAEEYVFEPIAKKMLDSDEMLREEYNRKLEFDEEFRNDKWRRLDFFYMRSVYFDKAENIYPILRVLTKIHQDIS